MSEMIDRIAAKLKAANETWARAAPMMDGFHMESVYHFMAHAVLEEMMKPTQGMIAAGSSYAGDGIAPSQVRTQSEPDEDGVVMVNVTYKPGIWGAMITAALIDGA